MADQIVNIKLLLAIIVALSLGQITILTFIVRKYISKIGNNETRIDKNEITLTELKTEHCMIQKDKTGMK